MRDLEERKGIRLHWYAVVQAHPREHTDEPHVHLVLAGRGEDHETGEHVTVRMNKEDYDFLREQGREHSNFDFYQQQQAEVEDLDRHDTTQSDTLALSAHFITRTAQRFIREMSK